MTIDPLAAGYPAPAVRKSHPSNAVERGTFANLLAATTAPANTAAANAAAKTAIGPANPVLDTAAGPQETDIDAYFTPKTAPGARLSFPPLLVPTARNIDTLSAHASAKLAQLLADNGIPSAPAEITYGPDGKINLPADYPYADRLKQALAEDPATDRTLRTVNALASHYVGLQESAAFSEEYAAAASQAEMDAILAKYSNLFSTHRRYADIALRFAPDGSLSVTANDKPLPATAV